MDRFPRLVQRIERRARWLQGMRFAGIGLLVGGTCALLVAWLYHLGILILDRPPWGACSGLPSSALSSSTSSVGGGIYLSHRPSCGSTLLLGRGSD